MNDFTAPERDTYRICTRCVMDTSDPEIAFDEGGVCNHCREFDAVTRRDWHPDSQGAKLWRAEVDRIKREGQGKPYDSILGLSGGVDSSYLALKAFEAGLRPLVVHVDAGWNSELAVANIEAIVKYCNFDLHTHVVNWEDMRDLHLAYLKSGVANQDVPQDHAFFASLYHFAIKNGITTILSGGNTATEGIFPTSWHGSAMDRRNLLDIHRQFGSRKLKSYQTIGFVEYYFIFPFLRGMRTVRPLNFMPYDKKTAVREMEATFGWRDYGRKHGESLFTKLFQNYILPRKYGYDKRRPHLASLIVSGQMTREDALAELEKPLYDPIELEIDLNYFAKKLRVSRLDLDTMIDSPKRSHTEFANWLGMQTWAKKLQRALEIIRRRRFNVYS